MANGFNFSDDGKTLLNCDFSLLEKNVFVPLGTQKIANGVFAESPVENVILPNSVTELGENVFSSSKNLQKVTLSENIKNLKPFTFSDCTSLQKIKLPDNLENLSEGLFFGCNSLEEINFGQNQNNFSTLERDFFANCHSLKDLTLPSNITEIKKGALSGCSSLKTLCIPATIKNIEDRSLTGLSSLEEILFSYDFSLENSDFSNPNEIILDDSSLNKYNQHFFIDENSHSLYQKTDDGFILIKSPANTTSIKLLKNTYDIHIDALDDCAALEEIFVHKNTNPDFVEKLLEQFSSIDVNSFSDEVELENDFQSESENNEPSIEQENNIEFNEEEKIENSQENQQIEKITLDENSLETADSQIDIDSILKDQACNNELDDDFRPVTFEELEALMNNPVYEDPNEPLPSMIQNNSYEIGSLGGDNSFDAHDTQDFENSSNIIEEKITTEAIEIDGESVNTEAPSLDAFCQEEVQEPRFVRALKQMCSNQLILEEKENQIDSVFGDLKDLFVFADGIAPSTKEFSSHLIKFAKSIAKKYGFTRIYFFNDLPLDNPEFIFGLNSFGNVRNILYACDKSNLDSVSDEQKELIDATGITLTENSLINSCSNFMSVKENLEEKIKNQNLEYPIKLLVQDNYVEGLLYCAEKYRKDHGIN